MAPQYFVQGIFAIAGLTALLASILNWNWFFTAQNAQLTAGNHHDRYGCLLLPQYATCIRVTDGISLPDIC